MRPASALPRRRARGFTLVELVAVMVILGALGVIAIPQWLDARKTAWNNRHAQVAASFATAVQQARMMCRAFGNTGAVTTNLANLPPGTIDFDTDCLPMGTSWSSGAPTAAHCTELFNALMRGVTTATTVTVGTPYRTVASVGNYCYFTALDANGDFPSGDGGGPHRLLYFVAAGSRGLIYALDWDNNITFYARAD